MAAIDTTVQKQRAGIFTMLLILSLMALVAGCVFLYVEMQPYDWKMSPKAAGIRPPEPVQLAPTSTEP